VRPAPIRALLLFLGILPGLVLATFVAVMTSLGPPPPPSGEWLIALGVSMIGLLVAAIVERGSFKVTALLFLAAAACTIGLWWRNFRQ
jgi:hypothetical protein